MTIIGGLSSPALGSTVVLFVRNVPSCYRPTSVLYRAAEGGERALNSHWAFTDGKMVVLLNNSIASLFTYVWELGHGHVLPVQCYTLCKYEVHARGS